MTSERKKIDVWEMPKITGDVGFRYLLRILSATCAASVKKTKVLALTLMHHVNPLYFMSAP